VTADVRRKLTLAHLPTPLVRFDALDALVGTRVWVKRDDASGGPEAGNKIRKLEYLLAAAQAQGARAVITCGGVQSNHARATAVAARQLGLRPILLLRTTEPPARPWQGNLLLCAVLGAEIRFISPAEYTNRDALMRAVSQECAQQQEAAYVIPEGGSNGLGALGYVDAMAEVRAQLDAGPTQYPRQFDAIVHACGSGGTAAGVAIGARLHAIAPEVIAMAVCDDRAYFEARIAGIVQEALALLDSPCTPARVRVLDEFKGPAYGVPSPEQVRFIETVARRTGLTLDPVYTGKALFGLAQLTDKPASALFLHTGGLPGLLAEAARFS
jgi:D-cysteine desulfhydrase